MTSLTTLEHGQVTEFLQCLDRAGLTRQMLEEIIGDDDNVQAKKMVSALGILLNASSSHRVTVPKHLTSATLVEHVDARVRLTYVNPDLRSWNYLQDEAGKTYEVMTHVFNRTVSSADVNAFFAEKGFGGNTAAFNAWVAETNPRGYYASIPKDDRLWCGPESDELCAPFFNRGGDFRRLGLCWVGDDWDNSWVFVAFREVQSET